MVHITTHDLVSQETKRNPCAFYAQLREQGQLYHFTDTDGASAWLVINYDDAIALLTDPCVQNQHEVSTHDQQASSQKDVSGNIQNEPTHDTPNFTRLRPLVAKAFTPRMIEQLRPRIQQITDELLDAVLDQGHMDLIADFAYPLPITVISELLGIPVTDRTSFRAWSQAIVNTPEDAHQQAVQASARRELTRYITTLLSEKRAHPGSDLMSRLIQVEEGGVRLGEHEIIFIAFVLLVAGHETTVNLIGNGVLALFTHPDQLHLLQRDPSLIASTVEELLRYSPPVSLAFPRVAGEDIFLHGNVIRKGEKVYISLSAANLDPHQFPRPDVLDITRQKNPHLAFGKGIHFCLGAPLARLEGQIALETVLRRLPQLSLVDDPERLTWNHNLFLRGVTSLPVTFANKQ
ncbi:cytochrome P450 [Ktedonosporobacter rubrisoli]|uniref:Cytochrome P450 n=1 Tax=Ktedonosporobacter rubrisoli TaxID=2509675 RepID=A0A4P6K340_KTERU|nr:cytochrome P450 [Ktedonosporobacter rubrisoli]QBD82564.1 cytochrome P450 [Ktedonosporobacter rubrisoli]